MFLISRKYDQGCSSRIWIPDPAHPGTRGQKGTGSRIRIRNTAFYKGLCLKMTPTPKIEKLGKEVSLCTHEHAFWHTNFAIISVFFAPIAVNFSLASWPKNLARRLATLFTSVGRWWSVGGAGRRSRTVGDHSAGRRRRPLEVAGSAPNPPAPQGSTWATELKVHKNENFLAMILNLVLFQC